VVGVIRQGDVWWTDLPVPQGSEAGYRRPVVVVQGDSMNDVRGSTVVVVPLTSNVLHGERLGTCVLEPDATGLRVRSVALAEQILTANRSSLVARAGHLPPSALEQVFAALDLVLGR
jgi:mRNA interferase MazF